MFHTLYTIHYFYLIIFLVSRGSKYRESDTTPSVYYLSFVYLLGLLKVSLFTLRTTIPVQPWIPTEPSSGVNNSPVNSPLNSSFFKVGIFRQVLLHNVHLRYQYVSVITSFLQPNKFLSQRSRITNSPPSSVWPTIPGLKCPGTSGTVCQT